MEIRPELFAQISVDDAIVLRYMTQSFTQREIAAFIGLQESTVKSRVQRLERIITRTADMHQLARFWLEQGPAWFAWVCRVTGFGPPEARQTG